MVFISCSIRQTAIDVYITVCVQVNVTKISCSSIAPLKFSIRTEKISTVSSLRSMLTSYFFMFPGKSGKTKKFKSSSSHTFWMQRCHWGSRRRTEEKCSFINGKHNLYVHLNGSPQCSAHHKILKRTTDHEHAKKESLCIGFCLDPVVSVFHLPH